MVISSEPYNITWLFRHDLTSEPRYLVTFTVGIGQKANINAAVKR
jgi:hypothetical protein